MPSLPSSKQGLAISGCGGAPHQDASESDMIDGNANPNVGTSPVPNSLHRPTSSCSPSDKSDTESKNFRNRTNTKLKLLVRSHAMRESTSPPREPHGNGPTSPHSPQSADGEKKIICNLSPNSGAKLNNNESIFNSNLCSAQSPKQMRNTATSPTCRAPSRNGQSSPSQVHSPKSITSPTNGNKLENHRSKFANANIIQKCNNCVKNNQNERPGLLQTPISPIRCGQTLQHSPKSTNLAPCGQNNQHKSEQRRPNTLNICNNQCSAQCGNTLSVTRPGSRHKLRHQNSSQGSYDSASPCLSRDSSTELYTDSTGIDLEQFIAETINRNQKDRTVLLKIEKDLIDFAKDRQKVSHKFPNMSSYNRMLVHRVAAYFGMEHNVDQSGLSVIVTRTKNMRIPDTRFKEHIRDDLILSEEPRRSILKRDSNSFEDSFNFKSPDRLSGDCCRRSKSFEEREEEYERARRRIFKDSSGESSDVTSWPWSSTESSDASAKFRLLHPDHLVRQNRLLKGESFDGRDSFRGGVLRPSVSKSFSFGGYTKGMLTRGDSVTSTHSAGARLMKQDSGASMCSRLSPSRSSSGYKSQSQRSDATLSPSLSPSPVPATMTCSHTQVSSQDLISPDSNGGQTVMWAVTSLSSVPPGSIIINPQTNQPYTNTDGSIYRYDPDNPPKFFNMENENGTPLSANKQQQQQHMELPPEPSRTNNNLKNDNRKQRSPQSRINVTGASTGAQVTNTATSPSLPFTPPPPPPPPLPPTSVPQNLPILQQQVQQQQPQSQPHPQQQSLVKSSTTLPIFNHTNQTAQQPYATYVPTSEPYNQGVYPPPMGQPTVMMASHPTQSQASVQNGGQGDVFNQNQVYTNYAVPMHQGPISQSGIKSTENGNINISKKIMLNYYLRIYLPLIDELNKSVQVMCCGINKLVDMAELSGYFLGMNIYDQRSNGDNHSTPPHSTYPPPSVNQTVQNVQSIQPNYWQPSPNQIPPQQTMYFVPPPGTTISVGQNPGDRQQLHQQQRFPTNYSFNAQTMTSPSQPSSNFVGNYPVPYNSLPAVTPTPGDYTYQPPVQMIPTYYPPGQPAMQPPPVMYRVPTPPNTPTSSQIPGMPLMYVNSSSYAAPTMVTSGTFGHQVAHNGTSPAPPGAYMAPTLVPNLVFRQNVPIVPSVRAATPGNSQRASRSPTPAHEFFGGGSGDRSAQPQPRYPLPMYQGVHIVQGDMRLMHSGVPSNSRLQYAPVSSPPVVQGCPRPYRPPSSNTSGAGTPISFDGRNQKIRKHRSKIPSLPPSGARPNFYQTSSMSSLPSNIPKDIREGMKN
ncbi:R3H domain-containing protein 1 [Trachymyrmex cornetzi]|uniref:R3H domain-containing protein 1 n=1 Tax=Trachymyrmex cornetzi TaxID=471704 RepID=A0A195DGS0_9HYME|nr:R3H domain-containing protein 1 [Trachymyrmex cornetzi]